MGMMSRRLGLLGLVLVFSVVAPAQGGHAKTKSLVLNFDITQLATLRHAHPPAGKTGVYLSTTLLLDNSVAQLGRGAGAHVGSMSFQYVINGACGTAGPGGCAGTTDMWTVTTLPGGTISAASDRFPLGKRPFVVQVRSGTGVFKGATGRVEIAAKGNAVTSIFLTLP
jgi:hypothetical protein